MTASSEHIETLFIYLTCRYLQKTGFTACHRQCTRTTMSTNLELNSLNSLNSIISNRPIAYSLWAPYNSLLSVWYHTAYFYRLQFVFMFRVIRALCDNYVSTPFHQVYRILDTEDQWLLWPDTQVLKEYLRERKQMAEKRKDRRSDNSLCLVSLKTTLMSHAGQYSTDQTNDEIPASSFGYVS